ncbi:MAG: Na+/H+ antiporter [Deltaproteobacteria bacterium]|nr:MAG: Na+/H+ antiporter [Deltaproteobacteria bacterium]
MQHAEAQLLILLLVAALVGMAARRFKLPYTVALVLAGIGLGFLQLPGLQGLHLTPELLMMVFLPALLFEASYHLDFRRFRREAPAILLMAVPGVVVAVVLTGVGSWALLTGSGVDGFTLGHGFLFASMIAATDPISVLALFKTLGVDKRLYVLVEGESLLNDGVAVVMFVIVAAVLGIDAGHGHAPHLAGAQEIAVYGIKTFVWMACGGVLVGGMVGASASLLTRTIDDKLIETALTVVVAYGSFLLAEAVQASGVLSTVAAGVVLGSFGSSFGMSAPTRVAVVDFWEFLAFFSNTFVFLLVGIELDILDLAGAMGLVLGAFVVVVAARAVVVYGALPLTKRFRVDPIPASWGHVMVWGGLRGSLSMVLVIGLPPDFPGRGLLVLLVFGVVSMSLLVQALTMSGLLRRLGLVRSREVKLAYERARGQVLMARAALRELERRSDHLDPSVRATLEQHYRKKLEAARAAAIEAAGAALDAERLSEAHLHLLRVEEDALRAAVQEGVVDDEAASALLTELADQRERMVHGGVGDEA